MHWIVLQLADSAFPTGGFAHSAGLEACIQAGEVANRTDVERFAEELIDQLARGSLPLVAAVHDAPERLHAIDELADTITWSHVAKRASTVQGRALLDVAARAFAKPALAAARGTASHLAPVYGFVTKTLDVGRDDALAMFLHLGIRGALGAGVRLGVLGPTEAQALHLRLHPALDAALARSHALEEVAQPSPIVELLQTTQDRLYSRLFQS